MGGGAESVLNLEVDASIPICYDTSFGSHENLFLLEVEDSLVPQILDGSVVVRGEPDEEAVLCTSSKTYALKFVSTSNSVFLVPTKGSSSICGEAQTEMNATDSAASVLKLVHGYMELVLVAPKLDQLKSLLKQRVYKMDSNDHDSGSKLGLYTWADLVDTIQASDDELRDGLRAISAVEIDGFWRLVDDGLMEELLTMLFHNVIIQDWSSDALCEEQVMPVMVNDGFSPILVLHCLRTYGSKVEREDGHVWCLNERLVAVLYARRILSRRGKMRATEFMEEWRRTVSSCLNVSMDMLDGEVLSEKLGAETWVRGFSVSSLPSTPAERFGVLFSERQRWEWEDLEPFVRDLHVPGLSSEGLLMKYTRRIQPTADATPIFSAR